RFIRIIMPNVQQGPGLGHTDPQLLPQLPHKPVKARFIPLQLAPGEFPQPAHMNMVWTPGNENPTLPIANDGSDHMNTARLTHCLGTSSENTSCSCSSPGITCSSAAQAPRSISRQRGEQKGRSGKRSSQVTGA